MLVSLFLSLALGQPTTLVVGDPSLGIDSSTTGVLTGALGNQLNFHVDGAPLGLGFLVFSPSPPFGAGSIGGIPIEVDLATLGFLVQGQQLSPAGFLGHSSQVPSTLASGTSIWTQAAVLDPLDRAIQLSNGVRIDLVPSDPADLPVLELGRHVGLSHSFWGSHVQAVLDDAYDAALAHGNDAYTLCVPWNSIEIAPGVYDSSKLLTDLHRVANLGQDVLLVLETIDGLELRLPSDLTDPTDPTHLAPGLTWSSYEVESRYHFLLDFVTPLLASNGGFYLSLGNEVDLYFERQPTELSAFGSFVRNARTHVHATQAKLAVGVTLTANGALSGSPSQAQLAPVCDLIAYTYFPQGSGGKAAEPRVPLVDFPALALLAAPHPLILQQVGYGSGLSPMSASSSSLEKQRLFVASCFDAMRLVPKLRYFVLDGLEDPSDQKLDEIASEHADRTPEFLDNRGSVGLRFFFTGWAKPAWSEYLQGLDDL